MAVRTLIADDDLTIRILLRRLLERHSDWRVCGEAVNGVEAVEKVKVFTPDLAILDLGMPMMNGVQAAREIARTNPRLPMLLPESPRPIPGQCVLERRLFCVDHGAVLAGRKRARLNSAIASGYLLRWE